MQLLRKEARACLTLSATDHVMGSSLEVIAASVGSYNGAYKQALN